MGRLEALIEAGRRLRISGSAGTAFRTWRRQCVDSLGDLLGPEHFYTGWFERELSNGSETDLLAGTGILFAAKETVQAQSGTPRSSRYEASVDDEHMRQS